MKSKFITPENHKDLVVNSAQISLDLLLRYIDGTGSLNYGYCFTNADILEEQIITLMENIEAGRVVRKPKLEVVS